MAASSARARGLLFTLHKIRMVRRRCRVSQVTAPLQRVRVTGWGIQLGFYRDRIVLVVYLPDVMVKGEELF